MAAPYLTKLPDNCGNYKESASCDLGLRATTWFPLAGQYEQIVNGHNIEKLELGLSPEKLDQ
jgi:hypothetical protein